MEETDIIEMRGVEKTYNPKRSNLRTTVLKGLNLTVRKGESLAVMGVSGSGKSTLLNCIGLIDGITDGTFFLEGEDVGGLTDDEKAEKRADKIGYVLQEYGLLVRDTSYKNVMLPLLFSEKYRGRKEKKERARQCLEEVGMLMKEKSRIIDLSGGQRQRVAIARALVNDPEIILADEPTGALDSKTKMEIMDILVGLNRKGKTLVMVTHDIEVAGCLDRVIYLKDGRLFDKDGKAI